MKTVLKPDLKPKTLCISKSYNNLIEKETNLVDVKFYQKLFLLLISFSMVLIFPESPRELENICKTYNPSRICNVW